MPKVRDYKDIEVVFDSSDTNLTIKHQTGDAIIPCKGGASIVPLPCGGGKSTATCDLVAKRCDKGIEHYFYVLVVSYFWHNAISLKSPFFTSWHLC